MENQEQVKPEASSTQPSSGIKRRGFASMSAERRRQIASIGGKIAHERGRAHVFTAEEAQLAGRKGGRVVSQDAEHMARIGSRGGATRWSRVKKVGQPASEAAAPAAVREGA